MSVEATESPRSSVARPTLSIVVPVYNSSAQLKRCLAAIAASDVTNHEVLVVDDGSTEPIEPIVAEHGFRYLRIEGPSGPARARNVGVQSTSGEFVAFVDADVCVRHDALSRMAALLAEDGGVAAVVGSYDEDPAERDFFSQYKNLFHHYVHQRCEGELQTFWTGCGTIRRDAFVAFGGFDERRYRRPAIEDIELGTRMTAAGSRIVLDGRIQAKHLKRWTFWNLLRTDVLERGIPWTRLMWRSKALASTLNVTAPQRLSVLLVYVALLATIASLWAIAALPAAALSAAAVTAINADFYRFFARRKGLWFAIRTVPLHWLYFVYCGLCVVAGTAAYLLFDRRETAAGGVARATLGTPGA